MNANNNKIKIELREFFNRKPIQKFLKENNVDKLYEFFEYYTGLYASDMTSFLAMAYG